MFALVRLSDHSLVDQPHEPRMPVTVPEGHAWWPLSPEKPSLDPKREVAIPGDLYADQMTESVRRLYVVKEKTPLEIAQDRGLHALKMLSFSDQGVVRALEDVCLLLLKANRLTLDDLPPQAAEKLRQRQTWRDSLP